MVGLSNNKIWDNEVEMKKIFVLGAAIRKFCGIDDWDEDWHEDIIKELSMGRGGEMACLIKLTMLIFMMTKTN